jgi:hypothetical protein
MMLFLAVAGLGERGSTEGVPGLPGDPPTWGPFFSVWATFAAASDDWLARFDVPSDDFAALFDVPAVLRVRAWHLAGAHQRGGREQPEGLQRLSLAALRALRAPYEGAARRVTERVF